MLSIVFVDAVACHSDNAAFGLKFFRFGRLVLRQQPAFETGDADGFGNRLSGLRAVACQHDGFDFHPFQRGDGGSRIVFQAVFRPQRADVLFPDSKKERRLRADGNIGFGNGDSVFVHKRGISGCHFLPADRTTHAAAGNRPAVGNRQRFRPQIGGISGDGLRQRMGGA